MYEFATGVINVWEKKILSVLDQERMLKSPDRASAFMVLFDTDLGEIIAEGSQKNIEDIFSRDLNILKKKLVNILDDKKLLASFLFLKFDALNLKSALKKSFFGKETKNFKPFEFSLEPYKKVESFLKVLLDNNEKSNALTQHCDNFYVRRLVLEAIQILSSNKEDGQTMDSQMIETAVDRAYLKVRLAMAKKENALPEMVRLEIDVANLRSLLGKNSQPFLAGGNLASSQIEKLAQRKEEDLSDNLKIFLEVLELAFLLDEDHGRNTGIALEKKLDGYIAKKIFQKEKEKGSGIEKVLAFFQKKMNSYVNIRLILFAKENNLPLEEIERALLPIA